MSMMNRADKSLRIRIQAGLDQFHLPELTQTANGDEMRYADKCATYTKGLKQDSYGKVNLPAYQSLRKALGSSSFADFENILTGGPRTQNGPQGALAFDLEGADSAQFASPPAPEVSSAEYGAELIELYWASLLRDVNFTQYNDPKYKNLAGKAADELSKELAYKGPRNAAGAVTPQELLRGSFPGELNGPYLSQYFILPTSLGTQPIDQKLKTYQPDQDYMTDLASWFDVQKGVKPPPADFLKDKNGSPITRFAITGRDLAAYTHEDVLYQAYFTAFLVLSDLLNDNKISPNPGLPYLHSKTENGFGTLGGPDAAGILGEIATRALKAVWYQKWCVHLRQRPESGGGLVHLIKTNHPIDCTLDKNILNSTALKRSFERYGKTTYLLSQAFPEGSPTHPAYPTGHGTVGGACITILKFFFDGDSPIPDPMVPNADGSDLTKYSGADAGNLTVNSELHKLASNVSFGHGIHAGIHWRSDTHQSILLGEEVAIRFLRERALTYNEPFKVTLKSLSNQPVVIENPGHP
jgi:hypothetical protein